MSAISQATRKRLAQQALFRCGYCLTQELVSGVPLTIEHLLPRAKGGGNEEENLWLSCRLCNEAKGILTDAVDPETGEPAPLFNPRRQHWGEHFIWSDDGTNVTGLTPTGRATVSALSLNTEFRVCTRALWVEVGWHPPE
ncbi:HNH endonuclease [Thiothrix fructosivorans]|uniref:HNH endonuclease n=1 Tax=Thiothrix fructosivorans TaxID=111770 RepID=A0A8B0SLK8_9GAMM|nr:HNH endonuclease signature motif containing protein [Thiothrix fructosivorans]MBO0611734.1 HNH endonuclease [Thiothrix fructosivorans]QTX10607.1 HNH endonuclease [Thiothrix fructosivorans]